MLFGYLPKVFRTARYYACRYKCLLFKKTTLFRSWTFALVKRIFLGIIFFQSVSRTFLCVNSISINIKKTYFSERATSLQRRLVVFSNFKATWISCFVSFLEEKVNRKLGFVCLFNLNISNVKLKA